MDNKKAINILYLNAKVRLESDGFIKGADLNLSLKEIEKMLKTEYVYEMKNISDKNIKPMFFHYSKIHYREANAIIDELNFAYDTTII